MDINRIVIKHVSIPNVQYNVRPALGLNPVGNVFTLSLKVSQSRPGITTSTQLPSFTQRLRAQVEPTR